jgi:hypothetical protein
MGWFILAQVFSILITIVSIGRLCEQEKDLEILILRQQRAILPRKQDKPVKPKRAEKMTLLGWHRELVRRKWSYARRNI